MDLGLRDRVAIVAAGSKGLGRAVAETLAAEGARVVVCARGQAALDTACQAISGGGGRCHGVVADVSVPADVTRVAAAVSDATPIATAAAPLTEGAEDPARVKVVCDERGRALYFSRAPIPHGGPWRLHVGLYAFTAAALDAVAALPPSFLERAERLEQLRWLEAGYRIRVVSVPEGPLSVDTPADLERARARIERSSRGV